MIHLEHEGLSMYRTILLLAPMLLASRAVAQTDAEFEAALRAAPRPAQRTAPIMQPSANPTRRTLSVATRPRAELASPGAIPAEWARPVTSHADLARADKAAWSGTLDPYAYIAQQAGPIPMFPGSRPLRCDNSGLRADFTFGVETSPDMRKAMQVIVHGDPSDPLAPHKAANAHLGADRIPATTAKLTEIERFLRSRGYIRMGMDQWRHRDAQPGSVTMDITVQGSPWFKARDCAPYKIDPPAGPWFYVTLAYPQPYWQDAAK
jgi:hypothetical protein